MTDRPNPKLFRGARRAEQLRQELERAPKRAGWRFRQFMQIIANLVSLWFMFGFVGVFAWMCSASWPEALSQDLLGWSFPIFWVVCMIFLPSMWFALVARVFPFWFDREEATLTNEESRVAQKEQERAWQAEDAADDERWQQRAAKAGSMMLAAELVEGHVSISEEGDDTESPAVGD
jgi:hypothetical protein